MLGEPLTVSFAEKPFVDLLADLRKQTGANIVLDLRYKQKADCPVAATLTDVRLYDALRILANMCDLTVVWYGNVYYVTAAENVKQFHRRPASAPSPAPATPPQPKK